MNEEELNTETGREPGSSDVIDLDTGEVIEIDAGQPRYKIGRRSRLNENTFSKLQQALLSGVSDKVACAFVNISRNTFYEWVRRGEADLEVGDYETIFAKFAEMVERARATPHIQAAAIIVKAMPEDPRLALEFLKARYPEDWKNASKVDVNIRQADEAMVHILEAEQENVTKQLATLDTYLQKARERTALPADATPGPGQLPEAGEDGTRLGLPESGSADEGSN